MTSAVFLSNKGASVFLSNAARRFCVAWRIFGVKFRRAVELDWGGTFLLHLLRLGPISQFAERRCKPESSKPMLVPKTR